jgi:hypothetical protein
MPHRPISPETGSPIETDKIGSGAKPNSTQPPSYPCRTKNSDTPSPYDVNWRGGSIMCTQIQLCSVNAMPRQTPDQPS